MGRRLNLADLATEPALNATVPTLAAAPPRLRQVPISAVAPNPINPRESIGDLSDLESMRTVGQLQPCVVVTRSAFVGAYPEHGSSLGDVEFVVIAGSRRRLAAEQLGLATLDIVVRDNLASDRASLYAASVTENIDRQAFSPLEEARAIERLVAEFGSGVKAGEVLGRTKGWVSQRLSLLKLVPPLQQLLRAGDLPVRDARRLAILPPEEQEPTWRAEQEAKARSGAAADRKRPASTAASTNAAPRQIRLKMGQSTSDMAQTLRRHLQPDQVRALAAALLADN